MFIYDEADWRIDAIETGKCQICFFRPAIFMLDEKSGFCLDCQRWFDGLLIHRGGKLRIRDRRENPPLREDRLEGSGFQDE